MANTNAMEADEEMVITNFTTRADEFRELMEALIPPSEKKDDALKCLGDAIKNGREAISGFKWARA